MSRYSLSLRLCVLGVVASLAAVAAAQSGYTETTYVFHHDEPLTNVLSQFTAPSGAWDWTVSDVSFFSVTGSEDGTPPWRLLFANLAYNEWTESKSFHASFSGGEAVTNYVKYYREVGDEGFTPNPGSTAEIRRHLYDHIVTDFYWTVPEGTPSDLSGGPM